MTTLLERDCDEIDCDLARIEGALDRVLKKRNGNDQENSLLMTAARQVAAARRNVRELMSEDVREATRW